MDIRDFLRGPVHTVNVGEDSPAVALVALGVEDSEEDLVPTHTVVRDKQIEVQVAVEAAAMLAEKAEQSLKVEEVELGSLG